MAALTPEEKQNATKMYQAFVHNLEDGPQWTSGLTPLQVVRKAFDSIKSQLSSPDVVTEFDEYLVLQEDGIRHYFNEPMPYRLNRPLAWGEMIEVGFGTQADQDKLDRAIYKILIGDDTEEAPAGPLETKIVKRSLLGWDDKISGQRLKNGDTVIRLNGDDRFIFEADGLNEWFRRSPTNPMTRAPAPPEVRETFILDIEEDAGDAPAEGGRRRRLRKTKKSKRRARKTRRSTRGRSANS
jgi:hypothetical protein